MRARSVGKVTWAGPWHQPVLSDEAAEAGVIHLPRRRRRSRRLQRRMFEGRHTDSTLMCRTSACRGSGVRSCSTDGLCTSRLPGGPRCVKEKGKVGCAFPSVCLQQADIQNLVIQRRGGCPDKSGKQIVQVYSEGVGTSAAAPTKQFERQRSVRRNSPRRTHAASALADASSRRQEAGP